MATDPQRLQLFERILKLLARAAADRGPEAQSARNLARTLMQRHGITRADLSIRRPKTRPAAVAPRSPRDVPAARSTSIGSDEPFEVRVKLGGLEMRFKL